MAVFHPCTDVLAQSSDIDDDENQPGYLNRDEVVKAVYDGTGRLDGYGLCSLISGMRK